MAAKKPLRFLLDELGDPTGIAEFQAGDSILLAGALDEAPIVTLASAATVNIGAAAANTVSISGTTTITAFDTIASGALRRLHFQGALTLTHNATSLILPTAANIATAAGDVAEFVSLGSGNWRCTGYERANGTAPALGPTNSPTFTALTLTSGQIAFPATQVPSANANTLDDYEEGTWTPTLTFATPGNLSVTYSQQSGVYTKIGRFVYVALRVSTSSFTHSTSAGVLRIPGLPFASNSLHSVCAFGFMSGLSASGSAQILALVDPLTTFIEAYVFNVNAGTTAASSPSNAPSGTNQDYIISATYNS